MKTNGLRIILLIFVFAVVIPILGCGNIQEANNPTNGGNLQGDDFIDISIYNIDEYNEFLQTSKYIPDDFITADMLNKLGTFYGFVCHEETDISVYYYSFIHEDRYRLSLTVNYPSWSKYDLPEISSAQISPTMITLTEGKEGVFTCGELKYYYALGRLYSFEWTVDNNAYSLDLANCPQEQLEELPSTLSEDSILRKLLSKDAEDQIAAFNQLKDMVTK